MKFFISIIFFLSVVLHVGAQIKLPVIIADAEKQTNVMLTEIASIKETSKNTALVSPRTLEKGEIRLVSSRDWTSGFFPGELWFLYEFTGKGSWKNQAELFTKNIENEQYDKGTHDLGFKIYCSVGAGYRLTKNGNYKSIIIKAAKTLSQRFNPVTGTIKSWDHRREWGYPTIIDNMMNLELLFEATKLSGDLSFYKIAVTHANTTLKNHFRNDNSSYHVLDYDTVTSGKIIKKETHQGYAHESAWARGQAWGLYGFILCYRETKDPAYLQQAERIAAYILNHPNLPKDLIPYWDFNAPAIPNEPRDVSAATITASALYELSTYSEKGKKHRKTADKILGNVTRYYRAPVGQYKGFLLLHSTGHKPAKSELDVPMIYADYYYLEALMRNKKLKERKSLF